MFPLGTVLLPGERLPLRVFEPRYRQMLADCLSGAQPAGFGVVLIERGHEVGGGATVRSPVGTFAEITSSQTDSRGESTLVVQGSWRLRVQQWLPDEPYPRALVEPLPELADDARATADLLRTGERVRSLIENSIAHRDMMAVADLPRFDAADLAEVGVFGWVVRLPIGPADRQALLAASDLAEQAAILDDAIDTLEARLRFGA